ncbi:hypothetical protein [Halosegnis marinus]|uniref:DUF4325 domain-containing protein n=1 Tax=Halosegnis marinus TaxID=3034023 RepID=A0ABD5ZQD0_9EURY|nr:hypothetical protein [Halosegnis sp. DT85]
MTPADKSEESAGPTEKTRDRVTKGSDLLGASRAVSDRVGTAVRNSYLYRWLTKEPEPEVIVIDLRETWTVGPIIALFDRLIEWLAPYWRESTPKRALDRVVTLADRTAGTRAGQLLGTFLAPPEPPDSDGDGPADAHGDADSSLSAETSDGETPPPSNR